MVVNRSTGEVGHRYSWDRELDGTTYVCCGNRRAEVCPSCSAEYKGDAWHLVLCGPAGGNGIPESVADHVHVRHLHAPSFGPVVIGAIKAEVSAATARSCRSVISAR